MPYIPGPTTAPRRLAISAIACALLLMPAATVAQAPERIDLPAGLAPEGITTDGTSLFVGSLSNGAIWRGDPMSGEGEVLAEGAEGRVTVGIDIDEAGGRIWAAGGPTGEVRAYDLETGELLQTYPVEGGFLNDVAVADEAVYVTDSFVPQVVTIPLTDDMLPAANAVQALPMSGELEYGDGFNVNGIVAAPAGLIVVHSGEGALFLVDPATGASSRIDIGDASVSNGDGLELDGQTLYVVRNQLDQVAMFELADDATSATLTGELTSDDLDVPTTAALMDSDLWVVNARDFGQGGPDVEYWITRLAAMAPEAE